MLCQMCQQAKATVHTLDLVDGEWLERHACEKCAMGGGAGESPADAGKVLKFFGQILAQAGNKTAAELLQGAAHGSQAGGGCPGCGMTHEQFQAGRRMGCARCYEAFSAELEQIFLRVQDEAVHHGKVPGRPRTAPPSPLELRRLRECLQRAVEDERFEEAAQFRDQINRLSGELSSGSEGGGEAGR